MVSGFWGVAALAFLKLFSSFLCFSKLSKPPGGRQPYRQQPGQPSQPRPPPQSTGGGGTHPSQQEGAAPQPHPTSDSSWINHILGLYIDYSWIIREIDYSWTIHGLSRVFINVSLIFMAYSLIIH